MSEDQNQPVTAADAQSSDKPVTSLTEQALPGAPQPTPVADKQRPSKKTKLAAIIFGVVLLLATLSAAVVFGYVLPNQPENVLKTAIANTAKQTKVGFTGELNYESLDETAELKAVKLKLTGQSDAEAGAFQVDLEITGSGITLPVELRSVEGSLFFKLGDLTTIKSLAAASAPLYVGLIDDVNKLLADQWIEVDETLLKQAGLQCSLSQNYTLSDEDISQLQDNYSAMPFADVTSTSSEQLDGRDTYKYEIAIDDDKGAEFAKSLNNLPAVKKLQECSGDTSEELDTSELADGDITPLTMWVDKDTKTISKITSHSTDQDAEEANLKADLSVSFTYGEANIEKPENTKPAAQLFAELQQIIYGSFSEDFGTLGDSDEPQLLPDLFNQL